MSAVELYRFYQQYGTGEWRYNTGRTDLNISANVYTARAISRSEIVNDGDRSEPTINCPDDLQPLESVVSAGTSEPVWVEISRYESSMATTIFIGRVDSVQTSSEHVIQARAVSLEKVLNAKIPVAVWSPMCRWALYGSGCQVNPAAFTLNLVVGTGGGQASISGNAITATGIGGQANGYWNLGQAKFGTERILITEHVGTTIKIVRPFASIPQSGASIEIRAGCDLKLDTCLGKFNNVINFGGFPWIPTRNPFKGTVS